MGKSSEEELEGMSAFAVTAPVDVDAILRIWSVPAV